MPTTSLIQQKNTDQFISDILPNVIRNKKTLRAIFVSYNGIGSYEDGLLATPGKQGLQITLSHGRHDDRPPFDLLFGATAMARADMEMMATYLEREETIGAQAQAQVENKIARNIDTDTNILLVSYMGLSAFDACLKFLQQFRQDVPRAFIVGVTCDCDKQRKLDTLASRKNEQNVLDSLIITPHCGGRWEMEQLLEALIEQWPEVS